MPLRSMSELRFLAACALLSLITGARAADAPAKETIVALNATGTLLRFNAGQPDQLIDQKPVTGLQAGERLLGIDYRVAKGLLYGLGSSNRLYQIDPATAVATAVGAPFEVALAGSEFGFDFNPVPDRIRVVSDSGQNLRLHPNTGAVIDADPKKGDLQTDGALAYEAGDAHAGKAPKIVAAAYTYNKQDDALTTNFALDAGLGALVTQGSREGTQPPVSPNTGRLFTVGLLGVAAFERAGFDISDVNNNAYAALTAAGATSSSWVRIDLATGKATPLGTVAGGAAIVGVAIAP
jgi:hypothetical protein